MSPPLVELLLCLLALPGLLPASTLFLQAMLALPPYRPRAMPSVARPKVAVVVPAHDEAGTIGATLRSIALQLLPQDRLLVVADNCTDRTAASAAAAGAEVIERTDPVRRGKGYALDFAIRRLERDPPEVVVVVDADCEVAAGAIERLARTCVHTGRPVQALYLMRSPEAAGLGTRLAEFAWRVRNHVRPLGYRRLGLACQLMGSGMAFPWGVIGRAPLASGHIVEDLMLGLELARAGSAPLFCPEARVTSVFPGTAEGARAQRARWEHGHLGVIFGRAPRLFAEGIRQANVSLLDLAVDLCVPPLALLLALILAALAGSALLVAATGRALPLSLAVAALALFVLAVLAAWARHGRGVIPFGSLAYAPVYALRKLPLYAGFFVKRQVDWVRTRRGGE